MIAYSIVILFLWLGSLFVPFWFVGFEKSDVPTSQKDSHFLRG